MVEDEAPRGGRSELEEFVDAGWIDRQFLGGLERTERECESRQDRYRDVLEEVWREAGGLDGAVTLRQVARLLQALAERERLQAQSMALLVSGNLKTYIGRCLREQLGVEPVQEGFPLPPEGLGGSSRDSG